MKRLLLAPVVVMALLLGACNADLRGNPVNTNITFTIEAFHMTTLDPVVPMIDVWVEVPGHERWLNAHNVPAPYRFTVYSAEYPQAAKQVDIVAAFAETEDYVDPQLNVALRCTWSAQTPSGVRLSRDSVGGEGESHPGSPLRCKYIA